MKILIVKLSSIGDVVHTLPVLSAVKRALPEAKISWVVEKSAAEILRGNELLENLIEIDTRSIRGGKIVGEILPAARGQMKNLRVSDFDLAIDFQGLLKSATVAKLAKAKQRYGFDKENLREPASRFLLSKTAKIETGKIHVIKKNLLLAEKSLQKYLKMPNFKLSQDKFDFPIFTEEKHKLEAEKIIAETGENLVILNPAGGWETKLWSAAKFGELADLIWEKLGLVSIVTTAPNEINLAEKVLQSSKSGKVFVKTPTLKGFYELAKRAKIYIGGDTAPTHLAVAADCPVVGIFGPTEWWRNGSPNTHDICVERNDLTCRIDCHRRKIGSWKKGACGNWVCMEISAETVFDAVEERLRNLPANERE